MHPILTLVRARSKELRQVLGLALALVLHLRRIHHIPNKFSCLSCCISSPWSDKCNHRQPYINPILALVRALTMVQVQVHLCTYHISNTSCYLPSRNFSSCSDTCNYHQPDMIFAPAGVAPTKSQSLHHSAIHAQVQQNPRREKHQVSDSCRF